MKKILLLLLMTISVSAYCQTTKKKTPVSDKVDLKTIQGTYEVQLTDLSTQIFSIKIKHLSGGAVYSVKITVSENITDGSGYKAWQEVKTTECFFTHIDGGYLEGEYEGKTYLIKRKGKCLKSFNNKTFCKTSEGC